MRLRFWNHAPIWGAVLSGATWLSVADSAAQAQVHGRRYQLCPPVPCEPCPTPPPAPQIMPPTPPPIQPPTTPPTVPTPPTTPTTPSAPPTTAPTAPTQPTEPSLGFQQFAALGGETVALSDSGVGYIDPAIVRTTFRLRFDAAYDNNRPDRAEFFYAKCGCFREAGVDPAAGGPVAPTRTGLERSVDYQEIWSYLEVAANDRLSAFVDVPVRFLNGDLLDNTAGPGDLNAGVKFALWSCQDQVVTMQLRTYIPTGDADRGLGTDHVSLEPGLLIFQRLSDRLVFEGELRDWIPIDGTDFAGNVLRYGVGLRYDVYRRGNLRIAPVTEFVGWTVLGGKELAMAGDISTAQDADGDTILNAKVGVRTFFETGSFYVGYGRALTGDVWYKDMFRVEYRLGF